MHPRVHVLEAMSLRYISKRRGIQPPLDSNRQFAVRLDSLCFVYQVTVKESKGKSDRLFLSQIKLIHKSMRGQSVPLIV